MKSIILISAFFGFAHSVLAQGTVRFDNNIPSVLVTHVYYTGDWGKIWAGNGPDDTPPGSQDYSGMVLAEGSGFSAQLWAAAGVVLNDGSLHPASAVTTFGTGAQAGFVIPILAELTGIPADSPIATLQLRVWDNEDGKVTDFFSSIHGGTSRLFTIENIGGPNNPPPILAGLESFSFAAVPEPNSVWLLGLGAAALLLIGRRNCQRQE